MDFEDIFENKKKHRHKQEMKNYNRGQINNSQNDYSKRGNFKLFQLLRGIKNNKKLKIIILAILLIVIAVIIGLVVFLFPLIIKTINYISLNGVSGLFDVVIEFFNKFWNGTK